MMRPFASERHRGDSGAAAVEFALVLPLLLLLVVGMLDFGMTYNHWISLTNLAHEGARLAAVGPATAGDVKTLAASYGLDPAKVTAAVASATSGSLGKYWTVTVTYPYELTIPGLVPSDGVITATARMSDEQGP
jgi:Flp pilus assembly protein TadG